MARPKGPGSCPTGQAASHLAGKAAAIPRARARLDTEMLRKDYLAAYDAVNLEYDAPFRLMYERGWFIFRSRYSSLILQKVRASSLVEMTERLRSRAAQAIEVRRTETQSGSACESAVGLQSDAPQSPSPSPQTYTADTKIGG